MGKDLDWVDYFDQAYHNAVVHGTGFIRVSVNGPEGLNLSVVDPKDYRYLMEKPPSTWTGLTDEHKEGLIYMTDPNPEPHHLRELIDVVEFQLKDKNT